MNVIDKCLAILIVSMQFTWVFMGEFDYMQQFSRRSYSITRGVRLAASILMWFFPLYSSVSFAFRTVPATRKTWRLIKMHTINLSNNEGAANSYKPIITPKPYNWPKQNFHFIN